MVRLYVTKLPRFERAHAPWLVRCARREVGRGQRRPQSCPTLADSYPFLLNKLRLKIKECAAFQGDLFLLYIGSKIITTKPHFPCTNTIMTSCEHSRRISSVSFFQQPLKSQDTNSRLFFSDFENKSLY